MKLLCQKAGKNSFLFVFLFILAFLIWDPILHNNSREGKKLQSAIKIEKTTCPQYDIKYSNFRLLKYSFFNEHNKPNHRIFPAGRQILKGKPLFAEMPSQCEEPRAFFPRNSIVFWME